MSAVISDVVAEITKLETIDAGLKTAVSAAVSTLADIRQQLADAIASNDPAQLQAVVDRIKTQETDLAASTDALVAAVQNVPPAPPVVTPVGADVPPAPAA